MQYPNGIIQRTYMQPPKLVTAKNIFTDEVKTFHSIKEAAYQLRCSPATIYASARGERAIGAWKVVNVG